MRKYTAGFTLIELLVVITIIGVLASITLASLDDAREGAKVASALNDLRGIKTRSAIYLNHTNTYPSDCYASCGPGNDPFVNSFGVDGWRGPYEPMWDLVHPWGGGYGLITYDANQNGTIEVLIYMDDDEPFTSFSNNQGRIPLESLIKLDEILDDGDLSTGDFVGGGYDSIGAGGGALSVEGEAIWMTTF